MAEMISHPQHYNIEGRKECIVEMLDKYGFHSVANFALLNSYKYLFRAGLKDGNSAEQDVSKAQWYFDWVTNKSAELKLWDVFDWVLYSDIEQMLIEIKAKGSNWKLIENVKEIGSADGMIDLEDD